MAAIATNSCITRENNIYFSNALTVTPPDRTKFYVALLNFTAFSNTITSTGSGTSLTLGVTIGTNLVVGSRVRFTTTNTLPAPLALATDYYVVSFPGGTGGSTLTVSLTPGGSAITYTTTGAGTHTLTEQAPSRIDTMAHFIRSELPVTNGYARANVVFATATFDTVNLVAYPATAVASFTATTAYAFNTVVLLEDASATVGSTTGGVTFFDNTITGTVPTSGLSFNITPRTANSNTLTGV